MRAFSEEILLLKYNMAAPLLASGINYQFTTITFCPIERYPPDMVCRGVRIPWYTYAVPDFPL